MFFRRGVGAGRWLEARIALFSVGALLALVGMALRNDWVIGAAGLILAAGILLGLIARRADRQADRREDGAPPG